jgi:hypothetical protein
MNELFGKYKPLVGSFFCKCGSSFSTQGLLFKHKAGCDKSRKKEGYDND